MTALHLRIVQMTSPSLILGIAVLATALAVAASAQSAWEVENAWMPLPPPGSDVGAVYLTLRNRGSTPLVITAVASELARSAMVHESAVVGGMARMRPTPQLTVAAGQALVLAPGGLHIMLMGLKSALHLGQDVPLALMLADGQKIDVTARVRPTGSQ
jgi:copper(I)-binding protein